MSKQRPDLWRRHDTLSEASRGPLFELTNRLGEALRHAELTKMKEAGERRYHTEAVEFTDTTTRLVQAHLIKKDPNIYLVVDPDSRTAENDRYSLTPDGHINYIDGYDNTNDLSEEELTQVQAAIEELIRSLDNAKWERERRSERRRDLALSIGKGALVLTVIFAAVGSSVKYLVLDPRERERIARQTYDKANHELPGEAAPVDTREFGVMSEQEFEAVPDHNNNERLDNPRTFELDSATGCVALDAPIKYDEPIVASVPRGSKLKEVTYQIHTEGSGLTLCLVDKNIGGEIAVHTP